MIGILGEMVALVTPLLLPLLLPIPMLFLD
uniref:Uncharacterized protein n=1 Tax=Picea glauca TaxID=3330 RepID=A0A117NG09_PICGL|nr:hypothetical protein ABT39_MTgene2160 [Picea glauca]